MNTNALPPAGGATPPPTDSGWSQVGREAITALLSLVILVVAMWAFTSTFTSGRRPFTGEAAAAAKEAYERQKDLLVIAMGLLGTVTGYYLGRVPAELRAQTAQTAAERAQAELSATNGLLTDSTTTAAQAVQKTEMVKKEAREAADAALRALTEQAGTTARGADARAQVLEPLSEQDHQSAGIDEARRQLNDLLRRLS